WVRSAELTPDAIVSAMRQGEFYASSGVVLKDFGTTDSTLWVSIEPESGVTYTTEFIGTRMRDGKPGEIGVVLASSTGNRAEYRLPEDVLYVRALVTSSRLHPNPFAEGDLEMAWVQPIFGPAAAKRGAEPGADDGPTLRRAGARGARR
ncbi:MAG: hypothetical protein GY873_28370, partial [Bosea sp.]|uniref:hypothetical protein n=1 Tax=Bosea sp. (in: a-proteobacteria) TaxID=1871050 RepID=UPI0023996426|nr:hypothetical protein [Bosea sp. (in: a-proteobacteria)]